MDQVVTFEFVEDFDFAKLEKCATNESVFSRVFLCRQGDYYFQWKLKVTPKDKRGEKVAFGFFLCVVDYQVDLSANFDLFTGDKEVYRSAFKKFELKDNSAAKGWGFTAFLPTVASLKKKGVVVDGVVKLGVTIRLNASDFDPFRWLPAVSLTPDKNLIVRHLFANLGTDDHYGTDFVIAVGEGDTKKELNINRLALRAVPSLDCVFNVESKENQDGVLHLPTHTADAVIEVLRYLYLNEVGVGLTRCLPSLLILASEWELKPLQTAIERAMIVKLQNDRCNFDLASDYLELATKYCRKVVRFVAVCTLMDNWQKVLQSAKSKGMQQELKGQVTSMMAAAAVYKGVYSGMDSDWLKSLPAPSLISNGALGQYFAANLGTDDHRGTDFIIVVEHGETTKELHVSRLALSVVPFFDRMFGNDVWKENQQGVLYLPTHTVDAAMEALRFVYKNEVVDGLTRFLPSLLSLASEWELDDLMVAIERDMVKKLMDDRFGYDHETAAEYFELAEKYNRKVVGGVAIRKLIEAWPVFIESQKDKNYGREAEGMKFQFWPTFVLFLQNRVTCVMAAIASGLPIDDGE